eukprot:TRINITY_DN13191_c0_g1_i1.p1 TRINITY_DN13191_c0_g1~~TRINITY_DN13191_c0_g1_i1.p1  ORF type:complete len:299 (+),score=43.96 TRINITY_DN13191_c0_g1_i1:125-1021(+)
MVFCCGHVERPNDRPAAAASDVFLNVYDITGWNWLIGNMGLGAYHSGVEVYDGEYCFGRDVEGVTGVHCVRPRSYDQHVYRETIHLGRTRLSRRAVERLVDDLAEEWQGSSYHVVRRNCNHFAEILSQRLLRDPGSTRYLEFPAWVNRPCNVGSRWLPSAAVERIEAIDLGIFTESRARWEAEEAQADEPLGWAGLPTDDTIGPWASDRFAARVASMSSRLSEVEIDEPVPTPMAPRSDLAASPPGTPQVGSPRRDLECDSPTDAQRPDWSREDEAGAKAVVEQTGVSAEEDTQGSSE